ncbi:beta-lactamase superfamily domain-domain-containing protein [Syncephalastrum racemosum]|uniref:Beta-lactamase superfamily domain-domain-containing protein n=1 Tax=Syncephalastrum racemosum TaxID=13706 RepID=A0A1X2H2V1_SYNRA|nr:beta-lactamase superfamily domain-domain-containing protein [Syncephalastrum racemosum]
MPVNKRPSIVNFPIPFDHPYTLPTLAIALAASSCVYYYLQSQHRADLIEAVRQRDIGKRRHLDRSEDRYASLKVEHHYVNPFREWRHVSVWETALFWLRRYKGNGLPKTEEELSLSLPVVQPSFDILFPPKPELTESWDDGTRPPPVAMSWLGQSTCLIRVNGLTILTDPIFTMRTVNDYLGPKRLRPIPCTVEDIQGKIDIVLVSHDHFDHLDEQVVHKLGDSVTWYVPLGLRKWFLKKGVENVIELDWWQEIHQREQHDVTVACVPAMHWSGSRTPFDKNTTLWCSYVIKTPSDRIFFCGDTGYSPELFQAIGDRYAPFSLAAIPIGSFQPTNLMQHLHMGPEEAVQVHKDLGNPRLSVGIHWGTFMMSDEHYLEPSRLLKKAWQEHSPSTDATSRFITTALGETVCVSAL